MSSPFDRFKKKFKAGDYVFRDGDVGTEMYILNSGKVELIKVVQGHEEVIAVLEKGDFFGEMAVLEGQPRNLSARAVGEAELTAINGTTFDQMIKKNIEISVRMLRGFSIRLREADAENLRLREANRELEAAAAARPAVPAPAEPAALPPPVVAAPVPASPPQKAQPSKAPPSKEPPAPARPPALPVAVKPSPAPRPPGVLVVKGGEKRYPLPSDEVTIGRADPVTGLRPDIDLSVEDINRFISRRHAKILYRDGTYFLVEEVGVTNGTYLNGKRLQAGVYTPIQFGDELCFGKVFLMMEHAK